MLVAMLGSLVSFTLECPYTRALDPVIEGRHKV
jgi:hypothetical protein